MDKFLQFEYELREDKTATITKYTGSLQATVTIPSEIRGLKITCIAEKSFTSSDIVCIVLPNSITKIERLAFNECKQLKEIMLPESIQEIDLYAFAACSQNLKIYYDGTAAQWECVNVNRNAFFRTTYELVFCDSNKSKDKNNPKQTPKCITMDMLTSLNKELTLKGYAFRFRPLLGDVEAFEKDSVPTMEVALSNMIGTTQTNISITDDFYNWLTTWFKVKYNVELSCNNEKTVFWSSLNENCIIADKGLENDNSTVKVLNAFM